MHRARVLPRAVVLGVVVAMLAAGTAWATPAADIASAGPLEHIWAGTDLSCQIAHVSDEQYELYPPGAVPGDCGTFIATGRRLYAPDFDDHDGTATWNLGASTPFGPVSQTAVTGSGTIADPFSVTTVADAGSLRVTQTDTYVEGTETYRTDVQIANRGTSAVDAIVYRAFDCYLQDDDAGYGFQRPGTGNTGCTDSPNNQAGGRIEELVPITDGSHSYQAYYGDVWAVIGSQQPFDDSCICEDYDDNGAGLSWNVEIPPAGSVTISHETRFSLVSGCEDGLDHLHGTPADGVVSRTVHDAVEPLLPDPLRDTVHTVNCDAVVPAEDTIDSILP